ncbi:MAG: selenide, water dikinase SelD [Chloroflexi bacterium RBG_16_48_8]|nr:MAG: selenide, water dikinase SelD [Chloroflexi bacterium RBG_16_48_8]
MWKIDDDHAIVVTTDFFTPIVDDPYDYGQIAAANALSDLYAMGAKPILALNIAAMPPKLPNEMIREIFRGGAEKVLQAGAVIAGGHTIQDEEPKYGLAAVGIVHPEKMMTKAMARPGDVIVLTKPLGVGVTTTALRAGKASEEDVREAVEWMSILNDKAAQLGVECGVRAATDVTGFSLLGHGYEVSEASQVKLRFVLSSIPFLRNAYHYAKGGFFPSGSANNLLYFEQHVQFDPSVDDYAKMMIFDAQTSGGLLLMIPPDKWDDFSERSSKFNIPAWPIGKVEEGRGIQVVDESSDVSIPTATQEKPVWFFPAS